MARVVSRVVRKALSAGLCVSPAFSCADAQPTVTEPPQHGAVAFVGVSVVSMLPGRPLVEARQTVVVRDRHIAEVGPETSVKLPADVRVLRLGVGATVIPGLIDSHVHTFDRDEFWLFLANGVTTIRNLHGIPLHLAWRDSLARGWMDGPRLLTAGPILDGTPPTRQTNQVVIDANEARTAVREQHALGYDYIKIYDNVGLEAYTAIVGEAHRLGLVVLGHLPTPVGLFGLTRESHLDELQHLEELLPFFGDGRGGADVDSLARALADLGVAVVPTVSVFVSALEQARDYPALLRRAPLRFVNPGTMRTWGWDPVARGRFGSGDALERFLRTSRFMEQTLLPALRRAGVRIIAGSDSPIPMLAPGFALLDELDAYVRSGLSPYEALQTATRNPAETYRRTHPPLAGLGVIATGHPADLVVVDGDPTVDLQALRHSFGTMSRGTWYPQSYLHSKLDSLARTYRTTPSSPQRM